MKTTSKLLSILYIMIGTHGFAQSDELEEAPTPPQIEAGEAATLKRQAGIGSNYAYAQAGVLELGGAMNYSASESVSSAGFTPFVAYFFADNFQLSLLTNIAYTKIEENEKKGIEGDEHTDGSVVIEPSLHFPLSNTQFFFVGLGLGSYFETDLDTGMAVTPRVGLKHLVGRSGMLTVGLQGIYVVNENELDDVEGTVITVENGANLALGYSVLL